MSFLVLINILEKYYLYFYHPIAHYFDEATIYTILKSCGYKFNGTFSKLCYEV